MSEKFDHYQQTNLEANSGYSPSAPRWLGILTVAPANATSQGTEVNASVETNYARQPIAFNASHGSPRTTENVAAVAFGAAVAGYTVVAEAVYDAVTGGNICYCKPVASQPIAVTNNYARGIGTVVLVEQ